MGITVDGDSLDVILVNPYLAVNFAFLCALSTTVIAYKATPRHKKALVTMIKERFPAFPTVMAVGAALQTSSYSVAHMIVGRIVSGSVGTVYGLPWVTYDFIAGADAFQNR